MLEYYYKRLAYKVLSWFIPRRVWRIELGKKLGFGERIITLQEVHSCFIAPQRVNLCSLRLREHTLSV
ncbi:hypothetical protein [uncultured Helicobacter sp.]|uniref:hypothetical protein n=1 Tax=uncultured Helicobacter sp. TaxID=175537 RepID=UPI00374EC5AC